jgi:hypothetical protein
VVRIGAGFSRAALQALRRQFKDVREELISTIAHFFQSLSLGLFTVAMAVLAKGDAVELIVGHLAEEGVDIPGDGLMLLGFFILDPRAGERMHIPAVVHQLIQGVAKGMQKVRGAHNVVWRESDSV